MEESVLDEVAFQFQLDKADRKAAHYILDQSHDR